MKKLSISLLSIFISVCSVYAQSDKNIYAQINKNPINQNEAIILTITIDGYTNAKLSKAPSLLNFEIVGGPSTSTSISIINGQKSEQQTLRYYLKPLTHGDLVLPSWEFITPDQKVLITEPISIKIHKGNASNHPPKEKKSSKKQLYRL